MFIITGCQRSGTTLLGMALHAHKGLDVIEEDNNRFHERVGETLLLKFQTCLKSTLSAAQQTGFKAPRDSHRLTSFILDNPKMKTLWLRRPVVQVAASMVSLKPKPGGASWAMGWAPREIRKHIAQFKDSGLAKDFERAEKIPHDKTREIAFAALCWRAKEAQRHFYQHQTNASILDVVYEDLVRDPKRSLSRVLAYLDVEWDDNILQHRHILKAEIRPGLSSTQRPIDTQSLEKWQSLFNASDLSVIKAYSAADDAAQTF